MKNAHLTGLGEPETTGKRSLFQPPVAAQSAIKIEAPIPPAPEPEKGSPVTKAKKTTAKALRARVHLTTDLTVEALRVIQNSQQEYRMKHGKVLPQWKAFSQAIEFYGRARLDKRAA